MNLGTAEIGLHKITLTAVRGTVVDAKKWSTTSVHGGGPNTVVSSTSVEHDQFTLRNAAGAESGFRVRNARLVISQGQEICAVTGIRAKDDMSWVLAIKNHATGETTVVEDGIGDILRTWFDLIISPLAQGFIAVLALAGGVAIALGPFMGDLPFLGSVFAVLVGASIAWLAWRMLFRWKRQMDRLRASVLSAASKC